MKEKRCHKCKLTYKGLKERCPFCHKLTGLGIMNRIMCVIGYITFIPIVTAFVRYFLILGLATTIMMANVIVTVIVVALIVGILIAIFR